MKNIVALFGLAILTLVGCATLPIGNKDETPTPGKLSPTSVIPPQPSSPIPGEDPASQQDDPVVAPKDGLITYHRSGGIAGIMETWSIYADGRITEAQGGEWQAPPERVAVILQRITELGFFEMQASYLPKNTCCDRFLYELTVQYGGKTGQVTSLDAAEGTPEEFWQMIGEVQRFLDEFTK